MTENLLQKLEERIMGLVSELENTRKELTRFKQENFVLRNEKGNYSAKLQELISLLNVVEIDTPVMSLESESQVREHSMTD